MNASNETRLSTLETLAAMRIQRARAYRAAALAELNASSPADAVALSLGMVEVWQDSADDLWLDVG